MPADVAPTLPSATPVADEPFSAYLARRLIVEEGFVEGTVPEAQELLDAADRVLTYADGYSCVIVCLMDRERDAARRFALEPAVLNRVGTACLVHTGRVNNSKLPVGLHVIEVGAGSLSAEDRERLERYKLGVFSKVHLSATYLDTQGREAWSNHRIRQSKPSTRLLRRMLREPRREAVPEETVAAPPERTRWLTAVLLGLMVLGFLAEHVFSLGGESQGLLGPSVSTLWGTGALSWSAVMDEGQWWRLLTAPLLHADLFHLFVNGVCLLFSAAVLERMVGHAWLGWLFITSGLGGGLMSLVLNSHDTVSVGASGAIMGLLAALLALSQRIPRGQARTSVQMSALRILLPSLLPLATTPSGGKVDIGAHLGGAIVGGVLGWALARVWRKSDPLPPATRLVGALGVLTLGALVVCLVPLSRAHAEAQLESLLIPPQALPSTDEEIPKLAGDLMARYPRDPRAHLFQAAVLLDTGDAAGAEREVHAALAEKEILELYFKGEPLLEMLHEVWAQALLAQDRKPEALEVVRPFCHAGEGGAVPPGLQRLGLCEPPAATP